MIKAQFLKRFENEIRGLERELKMELPKEIQEARELGDLRENAEYHAAKERQGLVQGEAWNVEEENNRSLVDEPR